MYYLQIVGLSHTLHALSHMKTDKRTHNMHFHAHINAQKSANTLLHLLAHKHTIGSPKKKLIHMGAWALIELSTKQNVFVLHIDGYIPCAHASNYT